MHISIIINGSNDLYSPLKKSLLDLITNLTKLEDISICIIYSLIKSKNDFWIDFNLQGLDESLGYIEYNKGIIKKYDYDFDNGESSLDIERALKESYRHGKRNFLIVSGHGGPFQCMLDMSKAIDKSYNTYDFCLDIRKRKYELVVLDMCAMNYIEVLYEILIDKKVKSILTYKGFAKFEGINYFDIIKILKNYNIDKNIVEQISLPFIYLENSIINEFEKIKLLKDELAKKCLLYEEPNFSLEILEINKIIDINIFEANKTKKIKLNKLNYIKRYLVDEVDRNIYAKYSYTKETLWKKFLFMENEKNNNKYKYIALSEQGLKNILLAHNPLISNLDLKNKLEEYYKKKQE